MPSFWGGGGHDHNCENVEQKKVEDEEVYGVFGDHKIQNKITQNKPDYKQVLGVNASNWIKQNYDWFYDYFKYF